MTLLDGAVLRTAIFMRKGNGDPNASQNVLHAAKLTALLHELGHVHDIEERINFKDGTCEDIVMA